MRRRLPFAGPIVESARWFVRQFGFELVDYRSPFPDIKDVEYYRPMFSPWLTPEWKDRLRAEDVRSLVPLNAKYNLYCLALDSVRRCSGDLAECGVYKGGTAKILAELSKGRAVHLFDTFAGMPETHPEKDIHKLGDFADTSLESVQEYLRDYPNVFFYSGFIPDSLHPVQEKTFSFVHVDLDIYAAIKSACEFFYPRLNPGGVLLFDDYGYPSCPGAREAVDEFFDDKPEVQTVMATGQCVVRKL